MSLVDTWMLLFVGASVGASFGFFWGAFFARVKQEDEQASAWAAEAARRNRE